MPSLVVCTGFEHGALSTDGNAGNKLFDRLVGDATLPGEIRTDTPRSGARYMRLNMDTSSTTSTRVVWEGAGALGTGRHRVFLAYVRIQSAPSAGGYAMLCGNDDTTGNIGAGIYYEQSTGKLQGYIQGSGSSAG